MAESLEEQYLIKQAAPKKYGWGQRHKVAALGFFGFFNVYAMRVNLSVAAIKMAEDFQWCGNGTEHNDTLTDDMMSLGNSTSGSGGNCGLKGTILGSFFFGYIATQILGGYFATKWGGKHVYGVGVLMTSILTLLTPWAAETSNTVLIILRIAEGFFEGVTYPAFHSILGRWVPLHERTQISTFVYAGAYAGTVVSQPLSAFLCESDFMGGWPSVFYVCGITGCVWYVFWILLFRSSPEFDPFITKEELAYIVAGRKDANKDETTDPLRFNDDDSNHKQSDTDDTATPWFQIFTSPAVWAIIVGHTVNNWGFYNLLTCLPNFMKTVLDYDLQDAGFISSVPYVTMWFVAIATGTLADMARNRGVKTVHVRKFCQCLGQFLSAITIVAAGYVEGPNAKILAVVAITVSVGAGGICLSGFNVNHLDLAPKYSGVLMGITNTVATIPGIMAPIVTNMIATANPTTEKAKLAEQWKTIFWITGVVYLFGMTFFAIFARGEKQPWADGIRRKNRQSIQ